MPTDARMSDHGPALGQAPAGQRDCADRKWCLTEHEDSETELSNWLSAVSQHEPRLRAYISRTTWNPDEVADLLADTIAEAWCEHSSGPSGVLDEVTLILHARRACARWKAAHRREVDLSASDLIDEGSSEVQSPLDDPTFHTGIVQSWLCTLPRQQQAAVVFREFRGGSFEHVAWCLECSVSAAKTHYKRGMNALRTQADKWRAGSEPL